MFMVIVSYLLVITCDINLPSILSFIPQTPHWRPLQLQQAQFEWNLSSIGCDSEKIPKVVLQRSRKHGRVGGWPQYFIALAVENPFLITCFLLTGHARERLVLWFSQYCHEWSLPIAMVCQAFAALQDWREIHLLDLIRFIYIYSYII